MGGVPLTAGPPFSKAILPLPERKLRGTVPTYSALRAKKQSDRGVRSAGNLSGMRLRGGHGADCTLATQPVLHIPAEDGPGRDPGTGRRGARPGLGLLTAAGWDWSPSPTESMPLGALPGKSLVSEVVWAPQSVGEPRCGLRYKDTGHTQVTRVTPPWLLCSSATFRYRVLPETTVILPGNKRPISPLPPTFCPHLQSQRSTCMSMCYLTVHIQSCLIQQNVLKTYLIYHLTT